MDRLFVTNLEDKEVLYDNDRDKENVRDVPPDRAKKNTAFLDDEQPV